MNEQRIEHLRMIQGVVDRLARCSFMYKGWTITIIAAIFALSTKSTEPGYNLIALIPAVMFWGLDAYYLRQERLFRALYDNVRTSPNETSFSMNTEIVKGKVESWWRTCWSGTVAWLYGPLVVVIAIAAAIAWLVNC